MAPGDRQVTVSHTELDLTRRPCSVQITSSRLFERVHRDGFVGIATRHLQAGNNSKSRDSSGNQYTEPCRALDFSAQPSMSRASRPITDPGVRCPNRNGSDPKEVADLHEDPLSDGSAGQGGEEVACGGTRIEKEVFVALVETDVQRRPRVRQKPDQHVVCQPTPPSRCEERSIRAERVEFDGAAEGERLATRRLA